MATSVHFNHPLQELDSDEDYLVNNERASLLETSGASVETTPQVSGPSSDWRRG